MKTTLLLFSALAVSALTAGAQNTPQDDYPNFPPGAALPMMATGGGQASGRINGGDDLDCFSFSLTTARTATLYTTGNTDTRGTLRRMGNSAGNAGTVIATEEGGEGNFRISRALEPGFYSICVGGRLTPAADGTVTGAYTLVLELTGGGTPPVGSPEIAAMLGDADLPNNSTVNFGTLTFGTTQQVVREIVFSNRGDRDLRLGPVTIAGSPMMGALFPSVVFRVLTQPAPILAPGRTTVCRLGASAALMNAAGIAPPSGTQTGVAHTPNDDADENPFVLHLTAEIVRPDPPAPGDIKLMHSDAELAQGGTIDFGTAPAGQRVVKTVAVSNTGTGELRVTDITIHGASTPNDPNDPAIGNAGANGVIGPDGLWEGGNLQSFFIEGARSFTLAPGASRNVQIVYAPRSGGTHNAEVSVRSNDPDENPYAFKVTGKSEAPPPPDPADIDVRLGDQPAPDNSTVDFGRTPLQTEVRKEFVVKNTGASPLNVRAAFAPTAAARDNDIAPAAAAFRIHGLPQFVVQPGGQRGVAVSFKPMTPGVFHALLVLSSNDPDENPWRLKLTGTGGNGDPNARPDIALSVGDADLPSGGRLDFGTVAPGQSLTKEVTIANTGAGDLRLTRVSFARPDVAAPAGAVNGLVAGDIPGSIGALHFRVVLPVNRVVPAGGRATMRVTFVSPAHGSQQVLLRLESNDPDESPYHVTLAGASSGEPPAPPEIALAVGDAELPMDGTLDFGRIVRGERAVREIKVSNTGAGVLRIGGIAILPPENTPTPAGGVNIFPGVFVPQVRVISGIHTVEPGGSGIIRLEFRGLVIGAAKYRASLYSNDADENPYRFSIGGEVVAPPKPKNPKDPEDPAVNQAGVR